MINDRLKTALAWCNEHKVKNQLELFNRVSKKHKNISKKNVGNVSNDKSLIKGTNVRAGVKDPS